MGHIARFIALLPGAQKPKKARANPEDEDDWTSPQSDRNVWALLAIMRMFLVKDSAGTPQNQTAFQKHGLLRQLLNVAFDPAIVMPNKIEALHTCADMIRGIRCCRKLSPKSRCGPSQKQPQMVQQHRTTLPQSISFGIIKSIFVCLLLALLN